MAKSAEELAEEFKKKMHHEGCDFILVLGREEGDVFNIHAMAKGNSSPQLSMNMASLAIETGSQIVKGILSKQQDIKDMRNEERH